ncbi:MAG: aminotransferase class IV, partial [Candidatus Aquilonibacter sp.]
AEGSAENVFLVRDGKLLTPDPSQNVLEGCTRRAIMEIGASLGIETIERSVDRRNVGDGTMGPVTKMLSEVYQRAVHNQDPAWSQWLTATYASRTKVTA